MNRHMLVEHERTQRELLEKNLHKNMDFDLK